MAQAQDVHSNYVGSWFQIIWILITSSLISILLFWPYRTFTPLEASPKLTSFTPGETVLFGSPAFVQSGMYIKDFVDADLTHGTMTIEALVWFMFDPAYISLDRVSRFSFVNGTIVNPDEVVKRRQQAETHVIDERYVIARFDIRAELRLPLQYDLFPIDDHYCPIILVNEAATPYEMAFHAVRRDFIVEPTLGALGWDQVDSDVRAGHRQYTLDKHEKHETSYAPEVIFSIDYRRIGVRYIISILLPLLLTFFVSLFAFSFDIEGPNAGQAFGFATGGITAMMAYYYVIQSMSPTVGYFMISDYLYYLFLLLNFFIFLIILFRANTSVWQKRLIVIALHLIVIASAGYLFIYWLR